MQTKPKTCQIYVIDTLKWVLEKSEDKTYSDKLEYVNNGLISKNDRESLLSWVVDQCSVLGLSIETGVLACTYIDRFLTKKSATGEKIFKLLGLIALSLACKYKESLVIRPDDIRTMLSSKYSIDAILTTELYMISTLSWDLSEVTVCDLIEVLACFSFEENLSENFMRTCFSYAAFCYCDSDLALFGSYNLGICSILLGLQRFGYSGVKDEWLLAVAKDFVVDREKIDTIISMVEKKLRSG